MLSIIRSAEPAGLSLVVCKAALRWSRIRLNICVKWGIEAGSLNTFYWCTDIEQNILAIIES